MTPAVGLTFGISVVPEWQSQSEILEMVNIADESGLDVVGIQDHPYQWRFYDTWTLLAFLAARTSQVRFFPNVVSLPMRPPAMLAKSVASLDVLSGGRVELGLGAGTFWEAINAMGGVERSPAEAFQATEEAIDVIRLIWSGERGVRYDGQHYQLSGVHTGPQPAHDVQIWIGARGPKMMDLIGRKADGWVPSSSWAPPEDLGGYIDQIHESAEGAGRDPGQIRVVYNVMGAISPDAGDRFVGPASKMIEELREVAGRGVDTFVFWPNGDDLPGQVEAFASEVAPVLRKA